MKWFVGLLGITLHHHQSGQKKIPVHWGLIQLAHHSWTEPVERVLVAAQCRGVEVIVSRPGESVEPTSRGVLHYARIVRSCNFERGSVFLRKGHLRGVTWAQ
jgi:hypothetical protein